MLDIGERIVRLRKQKKLSQQELADAIGSSRTIIGNYERSLNTPSIDALLKLSKIFGVSVDFLIGEGQISNYDKNVMNRIEEIHNLDNETRNKLFDIIDTYLRDSKARVAYKR